MDAINDLLHYLSKEDGRGLSQFLKSTNPNVFSSMDINSVEPNLDMVVPRKNSQVIKQIVIAFIQLNKNLTSSYYINTHFDHYSELLKYFNRFAETQSNWICEPLIYLTKTLILYAIKSDDYISKNPNKFNRKSMIGDFEQESCLIKTARIVHNSFKLCLNDRNENFKKSRKLQIYFFVGLELKIYFKLQNRDLAKNMEKVLTQKKNELPNLDLISKSQAITYLYYSGITSCGNVDFKNAYFKFLKAFQLCSSIKNCDKKQKTQIMIYLIPLKFLITKNLPNFNKLTKEFPEVCKVYQDLFLSLRRGDLKKFDIFFESYENFFLKKNLFLIIENIRSFVVLKLVKKVYEFNECKSHLPINFVRRGIEFSKYHSSDFYNSKANINTFSSDETECLLSNLIYKGYVKGYLSHTNGVLVLSKKDPFPRQVKSDYEIERD